MSQHLHEILLTLSMKENSFPSTVIYVIPNYIHPAKIQINVQNISASVGPQKP